MSERDPARPTAWSAFWRAATLFDRRAINPWVGLRNMLGVGLPLFAFASVGMIARGTTMSLGAFNVAFRDSEAPYPQRARQMLAASVVAGVAVFAGSVSGLHPMFAFVMAGVWAFAAGLFVAVSSSASETAVMSLVLLLIYAASPQDPSKAAVSGALAFAGGLLQTALALGGWPLRRYVPERRALGGLYLELARTAAAPPTAAGAALPATMQSTQAQVSLSTLDGNRSLESQRIRFLLSQAERIRLRLFTMKRLLGRLAKEQPGVVAENYETALAQIFAECTRTLTMIGHALQENSPQPLPPPQLREFDAFGAWLPENGAVDPALAAILQDLQFQIQALAGQLRAACELTVSSTPAGALAFDKKEAAKPWRLRLNSTLAILRANLTLRSAAFRHAIRLAVCVMIGQAFAHTNGLPRPYWLPMTVAIVLRSDFASTFSRGVLRLLGTFAGLLFATFLIQAVPNNVMAHVVAITALTFVVRCYGPAYYGLSVLGITGYVVFLLALTGVSAQQVMWARSINTAIGGVLALAVYSLWPTWERHHVSEVMAVMLDSFREYFRELRHCMVGVGSAKKLERKRVAARLARTNLEASIERSTAEPGISAQKVIVLTAMLSSTRRLAHSFIALETLGQLKDAARPTFSTFADHVELTLYYQSAVLRGSFTAAQSLPDLRHDHHEMLAALAGEGNLFAVETDRMTNSLNTFSEDVLRWSGVESVAAHEASSLLKA